MILIADKLADFTLNALKAMGYSITYNPDLKTDDLAEVIKDAEILVVRSTKVNADCINTGKNLSLIIRAGAGVNTIDLEAASEKGIHVANCPGKNTDAVAELAMGHIISADRRIVNATTDLRNGVWNKKEYGKAKGLKGRTLGIVGLGAIGKVLIKKAKAFGINVIAWSRSLTAEDAELMEIDHCRNLNYLAKSSDIVSIHLASNADTKHLINDEFFDNMKDGVIFVNTSRGEVVDSNALKKAITKKNLRVGLDVYENEPGASAKEFEDTELSKLISCTPHIGASTEQASEAIAGEVINIVKSYKETGTPVNTVNIQQKTSAVINLVVSHYNKVGVLAFILDELRNENINIEEMENAIFSGGKTAVCTLKLDDEPKEDFIGKIGENANIIKIELK